MTSNISFVDDPLARKVTRPLLVLQVVAMVVVVGLSFAHLFLAAFLLSVLTLLLLSVTLLWLYARYRELPVIREKRELERLVFRFQKGVHTEGMNIQAAVRERVRLFQAEKEEIKAALGALQKSHIDNGLRMASIQEIAISGVGSQLKERLAGNDIRSAADINETIAQLPGIGQEERQALLAWQHSVRETLESTQPSALPQKQLEAIQQRFQALQGQNNASDRKAHASQQMLEYELISFRERLQQLAPFTFPRYLSRSLASRGGVAAPLAFALILTQVVSSVSATASSIVAGLPTATASPTATITSMPPHRVKNTLTPAVSAMKTLSSVQPATFTATIWPTQMPSATPTQTPSVTPTLFPTPMMQPSDTALIPVSGGETAVGCDPAYPGVCIAPPPPDLDCKDVPYRRFQVLSPDPHNFDRDR